jgi:formate dehydrogenase major subunit
VSTVGQGKTIVHPGPHWPGGDTPINVGSYTKIKPRVDEKRCTAPCKQACPADTDIQGFVDLITEGQYKDALKLVKRTNPMPMVIGRVCPGFCETRCRRGTLDDTIAIYALERFVADYDQSTGTAYIPEVKPSTGHKVAIIGGGPAGLSAAYYLAIEGHDVEIFDASPQLGGWLRYGIPEYRLPKNILDKEIGIIAKLCGQIHHKVALGRDFTIDDLKRRGYKAIFIGIGAQEDQRIGVDGEKLSGVLSGINFLRDSALGKKIDVGKKVVVVGGGNTAVDAARTALRMGAKEVTILYRRSREEMPAISEEVDGAEQEGVRLQFLAAPVKFIGKNRKIDSIECIKMKLGKRDSSGRRKPEPIAGSEFTVKADTVISAVGQNIDSSALPPKMVNSKQYVQVDEDTMETPVEGVFAGGDCVHGPATVIEAIAAGRRAAISINQYLSGQSLKSLKKPQGRGGDSADRLSVNPSEEATPQPRVEMPVLAAKERRKGFSEIKLGFTEEMARREASRCLRCGACYLCLLLCPDGAIFLEGNGKKKVVVKNDLCKACGICVNECPLQAIAMLPLE